MSSTANNLERSKLNTSPPIHVTHLTDLLHEISPEAIFNHMIMQTKSRIVYQKESKNCIQKGKVEERKKHTL